MNIFERVITSPDDLARYGSNVKAKHDLRQYIADRNSASRPAGSEEPEYEPLTTTAYMNQVSSTAQMISKRGGQIGREIFKQGTPAEDIANAQKSQDRLHGVKALAVRAAGAVAAVGLIAGLSSQESNQSMHAPIESVQQVVSETPVQDMSLDSVVRLPINQ